MIKFIIALLIGLTIATFIGIIVGCVLGRIFVYMLDRDIKKVSGVYKTKLKKEVEYTFYPREKK